MALRFISKYNLDKVKNLLFRPKFSTDHGRLYYRKNKGQRNRLLDIALKFQEEKNVDAALASFIHAARTSPSYNVFLHYGEFLEQHKQFIDADYFYLRAIMASSENTKAIENRERIYENVNKLDVKNLNRIDNKQAEVINLKKKYPALNEIMNERYIRHIYLAENKEWKISGVAAGFNFICKELLHKKGTIGIADIRDINRTVLQNIDSKYAGKYTGEVCEGDHYPLSLCIVKNFMEKFIISLYSPSVLQMHPIRIAAYAHHKLVFIHPFTDGNGRTARLLMNSLLMRSGFPPITIYEHDRGDYYEGLQIADKCDLIQFYRFVEKKTEEVLDLFLRDADIEKRIYCESKKLLGEKNMGGNLIY